MGLSQAGKTKRKKTGGKRRRHGIKRQYEIGRSPANTRLGGYRVKQIRVRGGNIKLRAFRLDTGSFSWGSEQITRKCRIIDVVYNATSNEKIRTRALVKNAIVVVESMPFRTWYESHYAVPLGRYHVSHEVEAAKKRMNKSVANTEKYKERQKTAAIEPALEEQFMGGRVLACISSRPGQVGRADGYILEGKELEFYVKRAKRRRRR